MEALYQSYLAGGEPVGRVAMGKQRLTCRIDLERSSFPQQNALGLCQNRCGARAGAVASWLESIAHALRDAHVEGYQVETGLEWTVCVQHYVRGQGFSYRPLPMDGSSLVHGFAHVVGHSMDAVRAEVVKALLTQILSGISCSLSLQVHRMCLAMLNGFGSPALGAEWPKCKPFACPPQLPG